jgi:arginase family enzyme
MQAPSFFTQHKMLITEVAIDESVAPASAMATSGSMSYREITSLCTYLGKTGKVIGLDIAELTPATDVEGKTAELCFELSAATLGGRYGWYERYLLEHSKKE